MDRVKGLGGRLIPGVEALLDVEYIEAVAAPIPLTVWEWVMDGCFECSRVLFRWNLQLHLLFFISRSFTWYRFSYLRVSPL